MADLWQKQAHGSYGCAGDYGRSIHMVVIDVLGIVVEAGTWWLRTCWGLWKRHPHGSGGCAGDCGRSRHMVVMDVLGIVAEASAW